ncbi:MAG: DUF1015 family protein [Holophagales bacterium]|jgi:uncharacterized protein (DUF1015 family)|nr:DUF1015 family protein [Holophagales bacterium]
MSRIKPFRAFRPKAEFAADIASVPYDVINSKEARQLASGNPRSFLRVGRPEINLPEGVDEHSDEVYAAAVKALQGFIKEGTLFQENKPCFYIYQQRMGGHVQAGLVCLCSVKEYESNLIKKHEYTRKDKEDDRTRHVTEQGANAEPVFLTYPALPYIDSLVNKARETKPVYDITTSDEIGHTVWVINDESVIYSLTNLFSGIPALYIADGHHRTAAAIRYGQARRAAAGTDAVGEESFEYFMAAVFPHNQLKVMDYNRVVKDLNGLTKDQFLTKAREKFEISPSTTRAPNSIHTFGMYLDGQWHTLTAKPGTWNANDHVKSLDVSILQDNLLQPILGIQDPRTDTRIDFIGGIRGMEELEKRVREGAAVAFAMFPTSLEELMAVSDAGQIMPPKSTWFEPKLRSGLLVRVYEE